ncbi:MAG: ankyrin repeat domain-containing protein [Candidatus Babeliaceae bacterium]
MLKKFFLIFILAFTPIIQGMENVNPQEIQQPIIQAFQNGDIDGAITMLQQHAIDPNVIIGNKFNETPLHLAVCLGEKNATQKLLDMGANPHARTCDGLTPLHYIALSHNPEIVNWLLTYGADINAQDAFGDTALFSCLKADNNDAATNLLQRGASPHINNSFQHDPLMHAFDTKNITMIDTLFSYGAKKQQLYEKNTIDVYNNNSLMECIFTQLSTKNEVLQAILSGSHKNNLRTIADSNKRQIDGTLRDRILPYLANAENVVEVAKEIAERFKKNQELNNKDQSVAFIRSLYTGNSKTFDLALQHLKILNSMKKNNGTPTAVLSGALMSLSRGYLK